MINPPYQKRKRANMKDMELKPVLDFLSYLSAGTALGASQIELLTLTICRRGFIL